MLSNVRTGDGTAVGRAGVYGSLPAHIATALPMPAELLLSALKGHLTEELPRQFVEFLRALPIGIFIADAGGREIHRNQIACELIGSEERDGVLPDRDAGAKRLFRCGTDEPYPEAEVPLLRALAGERSTADLEVQHSQRGRIRLRAWGAPLLDEDGEVRLAIVAFVDVTAEKLLEDALREQSTARERERIAEAIHDDVLQLLATARLCLSLPREGDGTEATRAEAVDPLLAEAAGQLRRILAGLRPDPREDRPLADALLAALAPLEAEGVEITVRDSLGIEPPEPASSALRRVCEEAIVNIRKHAKARRVGVSLERHDGRVLVSVVDDGVGFLPRRGGPAGHFGISLMRERIACLGGELRIDSLPGRGTAVRIWIPERPARP